MYNRYQGNTGRVRRVEDGQSSGRDRAPQAHRPQNPPQGHNGQAPHRPPQSPARPVGSGGHPGNFGSTGLMEQIGRLLPGTREELETEDLILLLILYLMYRESGDSELLMIMGAMFLL